MTKIEGKISTPNYRQNVLMSINTLVDIDIGLFKLIRDEYLDPEVFDKEFFYNSRTVDFIRKSYHREEENPLYDISVIKDKKLLDEYYIEFNQTQYNEIYDRSVYTDVLPMLHMFIETHNIDITILYYKDYCKQSLEEDIKNGTLPKEVNLLNIKDLTPKELNKFTSIYVRSVHEIEGFDISGFTSPKCFYISSFRPNYNKKMELLQNDVLYKIMKGKLMHEINIFDMYNEKNLSEDQENK